MAGRVVGFEVASGVEADACCIGDFEDIGQLRGKLNFTTCIQCPFELAIELGAGRAKMSACPRTQSLAGEGRMKAICTGCEPQAPVAGR